jgi:hypothetical protein
VRRPCLACSYEVGCSRGITDTDLVAHPIGWAAVVLVLGFLAGFILWLTVKVTHRTTSAHSCACFLFKCLCFESLPELLDFRTESVSLHGCRLPLVIRNAKLMLSILVHLDYPI